MKRVHHYFVLCLLLAGAAHYAGAQPDDPALIWTFEGHKGEVRSVAFSPDGRYALLSNEIARSLGSNDEILKLWEVATGELARTFGEKYSNKVNSVAFSPDGHYALLGSNNKALKLWEVATGRLIRTFEGHKSNVNSVAFSPDGRNALSGSWDGTLKLWEVATGRLIRTFVEGSSTSEGRRGEVYRGAGPSYSVYSVAFSPDGRNALSGSKHGAKLWDVSPWTKPAEVPHEFD